MTYRLTTKTPPSVEPISLAEAQAHLRDSATENEADITRAIVAAREMTESITHRALINRTYNFYLDSFADEIQLPMPPLSSVTSVKYTDTDAAEQTLDSGVYTVDTDAEPGLIYLAYDQDWPDVLGIRKAVNIEYVAGYGATSASVPSALKQAMLLLIGHIFEHRESVSDFQVYDVPMGYEALVFPKRVIMAW